MKKNSISSWSNILPTKTCVVQYSSTITENCKGPFIARGSGRSYGDQAYISNGTTVSFEDFNTIREFDRQKGTIVCGAGVKIGELFNYLDGSGWSFPIAGGTQWVTIGGAVASDIHGKNDFLHGSFGNHVESLSVCLADGQQIGCSKQNNYDLFKSTIGAMGLTGFVNSIKLKLNKSELKKVEISTKTIHSPEEAINVFRSYPCDMQVAWLDLMSKAIKGVYYSGVLQEGKADDLRKPIETKFPCIALINRHTARVFNTFRYFTQRNLCRTTHFLNFHYSVDRLKCWNMLYGPKGFQEYQFRVSEKYASYALKEFINSCNKFSCFPFFTIIKKLGNVKREGLLSFPDAGFTLTADFPISSNNQDLFSYFTDFIIDMGGKIYLAKDSCLKKRQFEKMESHIQQWRDIVQKYDPKNIIQSDLSVRLGIKPW